MPRFRNSWGGCPSWRRGWMGLPPAGAGGAMPSNRALSLTGQLVDELDAPAGDAAGRLVGAGRA